MNIAAMEVLVEQAGGALRDRGERRAPIGIEAILKRAEQAVVGTPVEISKHAGWPRAGKDAGATRKEKAPGIAPGLSGTFRAGEFLQPAEQGVNDDDVRI